MHPLVSALEGTLIVSCQAYPGEPMRDPRTMAQVAAAVETGGASAVRAQGLEDIRAVKAAVDIPVIGIWKDGTDGVFITPTLDHALAVLDAGADILALDGTTRPRPDGRTLAQTVEQIRTRFDGPLMADCDSLDAALAAADLGIDIIGTTLAGYTPAREKTTGPDLDLLHQLAGRLPTTSALVAEGRVHTPDQAAAARTAGAHAVVVGTAITHPTTLTTWFRTAVTDA
ncbi:N-acetylmannosamine-6-phosphate 2-epimerase [Brachybacterium saurashtrense]|uniref:Putative N-acetylmannosamine-6-phosphate 2-epimerase n=1 Tax=Brachybacterium saurashtrense TaxID=556288 RepID=A0A345YKF9_9MICO|nr:N-acetylmannosamine-6-phosphate 2-epimerase [Brachybacterium saurashtrense]AXK44411.1 N-acetylmannosamine-6-phosphate 2-epimerase [Brachybacterium saurashtrense]RRR23022.1 N-acetylmannosamine-6-phosphate 2-epimerase [Brachybacterium saurashtrense]